MDDKFYSFVLEIVSEKLWLKFSPKLSKKMSTKLSTGHPKVTNTTFNVKMTSYASTLNWRQTTDTREKIMD